ncbi:MAG: FG-GAP-like repeat-containing protein [Alphaproteobacteria bacterium]|nr:FG-GAP-like repeat-containing protein [Alphaproteobacteria bacterium]
MPSYTFTGGSSGGGFNMGLWNAGFLLSLIADVNTTVAGNASHVTYTNNLTGGGPSVLDATGTFGNFDQFGDPTSGTVTGFVYTTRYFVFGVPVSMAASGVSISVPTLYGWAITNNAAALELALFGGNDTIVGTAFADTLFGFGGQDNIDGGDGDDQLSGGDSNDTVNGGAGNDRIELGVGNDTLNGGDGNDLFVNDGGLSNTGVDVIDGGAGIDSIELVLMTGNVNFNPLGMSTNTGVTLATGTTIRNVETVALQTGDGNDTVTLVDGVFIARFYGGGGTDTLVADYSNSTESWNLTPSSSSLIGNFNGAALDSVERYLITTGSGADTLRGGSGNDVLNAGGGDDALFGGLGVNTLNGGDGNDYFDATEGGSNTVNGGNGFDTASVRGLDNSPVNWNALASGSYGTQSFQSVESFIFSVGSNSTVSILGAFAAGGWLYFGPTSNLIMDLTGSTGALTSDFYNYTQNGFTIQIQDLTSVNFTGGSGNDSFYGRSGNDILNGGGGNDLLNGYTGADTINGGSGVDGAIYEGFSSGTVSWHRNSNGTWTVDGLGYGIDTLTNVEYLHLVDRDVILDNAFRTFTGDGTSDLLWRNANTGAVAVWQMSGATQTNAYIAGGAPADWTILGTGDFFGDGRDDIIWRNPTTTAVAVWANGSGTAASIITGVPNNWQFQGVGDFNFDGRDDFVWRNDNDGAVAVWLMNGNTIASQSIVSAAPAAWSIAGIADFDGDGRDDFLLRNTDGTIARWTTDGVSQTGAAIVGSAPSQWQIQGVGDLDGDGRADILFRDTSDGTLAMWRMNGNTALGVQIVGGAPLSWSIANVGDYNGDGRDDILWHNNDGTVALWTMNGFVVQNQAIVANVPVEWGLI